MADRLDGVMRRRARICAKREHASGGDAILHRVPHEEGSELFGRLGSDLHLLQLLGIDVHIAELVFGRRPESAE